MAALGKAVDRDLGRTGTHEVEPRERLLRVLSAATFLIFFQAYAVAPLIPRLSVAFNASAQMVGLAVPAYLIPYGVSTLVYGFLSARIGRRRIMLASLTAFVVLTAVTATAQTTSQLILWRFLTGLGASGVVPLALALVGQLFPFEQRGRPLGWLFGAMAGGMAFGSTFGVLLEPLVGWRGVFLGVSVLGFAVLLLLLPYRHRLGEPSADARVDLSTVFKGYGAVVGTARGRRTYGYVLLNAVFHSGIYTWLGLYFAQRYRLGEVGIGLALLGYGVPGFLFGPIIGRAADRWGRRWIIPLGLAIAGLAAGALALELPLGVAVVAVTFLSLGYDMTQPMFAGIVTAIGGSGRGGLAMGLNVFTLFTGFGLGSLLFGILLKRDFGAAFTVFTTIELGLAFLAILLFKNERVGSVQAVIGQNSIGRLVDRRVTRLPRGMDP